jgi:hypothetical protein
VERLHRPLGYVVLLAGAVAILSGIVVGVTGDDKPPYNDPTIAVVAWGAMMIAGAAFLVLGVAWVVIAALKERQRSRA